MSATPTRSDPIHEQFYKPLHVAEAWGDRAFYLSAALSIAVLFVTKDQQPLAFDILNALFVISVAGLFVIGLVSRLYFMRRADNARIRDFFEKAFAVPLTSTATVGYYNNAATDPIRRVAAMTMENAFFSKSIALKMLHRERSRAAVYVMIYLAALAMRRTEFTVLVAVSQFVLSEQVLVKWIKLEWLRKCFEEAYECTSQLFQAAPKAVGPFRAQALAAFTMYETAKANAALTLSNDLFNQLNPDLSNQWDTIRAKFNVI